MKKSPWWRAVWRRFGRRYHWLHLEGVDWLLTLNRSRETIVGTIYRSMTGPPLAGLSWCSSSSMELGRDFLMGSARETIKRIRAQQLRKREGVQASCAWMREHTPVLHELMCVPVTEGKAVLPTASLSIFVQDGAFKACLNDKATGMQLWATGDGLLAVVEVIELKLGDDEADWRPQPSWKAKKKS